MPRTREHEDSDEKSRAFTWIRALAVALLMVAIIALYFVAFSTWQPIYRLLS